MFVLGFLGYRACVARHNYCRMGHGVLRQGIAAIGAILSSLRKRRTIWVYRRDTIATFGAHLRAPPLKPKILVEQLSFQQNAKIDFLKCSSACLFFPKFSVQEMALLGLVTPRGIFGLKGKLCVNSLCLNCETKPSLFMDPDKCLLNGDIGRRSNPLFDYPVFSANEHTFCCVRTHLPECAQIFYFAHFVHKCFFKTLLPKFELVIFSVSTRPSALPNFY